MLGNDRESETKQSLKNILDYIIQLVSRNDEIICHVKDYKNLVLYEDFVLNLPGVYLNETVEDLPLWMRIERLTPVHPPKPDSDISPWMIIPDDPNKKPIVRDMITKENSTSEIKRLINDQKIQESDICLPEGYKLKDVQAAPVTFHLKRDSDTQEKINLYINHPWRLWAEQEIPRRQSIKIYSDLFTVQRILSDQSIEQPIEIVWGVGVVLWKTDQGIIHHPLLELLVEIDIDTQNGDLLIRPRDRDPSINDHIFSNLHLPNVQALRDYWHNHWAHFQEQELGEISPFYRPFFVSILQHAANCLCDSGRYYPNTFEDSNQRSIPLETADLVVTDTWILYCRERSKNIFRQDIEKLKEELNDASEEEIPSIGGRIVYGPPDRSPMGTGIPVSPDYSSDPQENEFAFYFPKPYNDSQLEIIQKLRTQEGIVVQGPPGTGKTHTIANIICHYLAEGKRVLVTSKGEAALEVLRQQIPDEIRDLCISLLTQEREGLKQLENAVRTVANTIQQINPSRLEKEIKSAEQTINQIKAELQRIDRQMEELARIQLNPIGNKFGEEYLDKNPAHLAEILMENQSQYQWFPDDLGDGQEYDPQFTDEDIQKLREIRVQLKEKIIYAEFTIPQVSELPDVPGVMAMHQDLVQAGRISQQLCETNAPIMSLTPSNALERADSLLAHLKKVLLFHDALEKNLWFKSIVEEWIQNGITSTKTELLLPLLEQTQQLADKRKNLFTRSLYIPEYQFYSQELKHAVERGCNGQRPFSLIAFGQSKTREMLSKVLVDGANPSSSEDWKYIRSRFEFCEELKVFILRWNQLAPEYDLPLFESSLYEAEKWVIQKNDLFQQSHSIMNEVKPLLINEIPKLFPQGLFGLSILQRRESCQKAIEVLELNISNQKFAMAHLRIEKVRESLAVHNGPIVDQVKVFLKNSLGNLARSNSDISEEWQQLVLSLNQLNQMTSEFQILLKITQRISQSGATTWAKQLRSIPVKCESDTLLPTHWNVCWNWKRMESYLKRIDSQEQIKKLSHDRHDRILRRERTFSNLVRMKTEIGLKNRLSESIQSSLLVYMRAITNIRGGRGIRAPRFRQEARMAMQKCYSSVPCWIMPNWRVSESLPAKMGSFDLVIIDEASQSDITVLPTLLRGQKVLIVGDDKQVSPEASFILEATIQQLQRDYLRNLPLRSLMLPGSSIYDLGSAIFPSSRTLLNEHFRCVEPIIRFSFQFYTEEIRPVRIPKPSERLNPPLIDVYLPHGEKKGKINPAEADAIVNEIEKLTQDESYHHRSIGIVSLTGYEQAIEIHKKLLARIGEPGYIHHRIACGDSSIFQGKERDIMFVSMVASPGQSIALTDRRYEQRFNVALSRARDRMYLYRSVDFKDLRDNDLRSKVIQHFNNPVPHLVRNVKELIELCQSNFEKDFFRRMIEKGYRLIPQVGIGGYFIDFIVEGQNDRRLAIELDGDQHLERWQEDIKRQRILERTGVEFWRCWQSCYILDQDRCIQELIEKLNEMEIEPIGYDGVLSQYTEHRILHKEESSNQGLNEGESQNHATEDLRRVESGDMVLISLQLVSQQPYQTTIHITPNVHDPERGLYRVDSEMTRPILERTIDDEVELYFNGETRKVTILDIKKKNT